MNRYIYVLCLIFISFSCQSPSNESNIQQAKKALHSSLTSEINNQNLDDTIFQNFFDASEQEAFLSLKKAFDRGLCKKATEKTISERYQFHSWLIRSNMFDKIPIYHTFPHDGSFQLDDSIVQEKLSSIWNNKCGFQKADDSILHYFCLDANNKVINYFKELSKNNKVIETFTNNYIKNKVLSPDDFQSYVLNTNELNFSKVDHQIFHMLFHVTINEEQQTMKKLSLK